MRLQGGGVGLRAEDDEGCNGFGPGCGRAGASVTRYPQREHMQSDRITLLQGSPEPLLRSPSRPKNKVIYYSVVRRVVFFFYVGSIFQGRRSSIKGGGGGRPITVLPFRYQQRCVRSDCFRCISKPLSSRAVLGLDEPASPS